LEFFQVGIDLLVVVPEVVMCPSVDLHCNQGVRLLSLEAFPKPADSRAHVENPLVPSALRKL
jgi:hypothetical protein